jgi:hypothetical protein
MKRERGKGAGEERRGLNRRSFLSPASHSPFFFPFSFSLVCLLLLISLAACGVKNNPEKPNSNFPRAYPVK